MNIPRKEESAAASQVRYESGRGEMMERLLISFEDGDGTSKTRAMTLHNMFDD